MYVIICIICIICISMQSDVIYIYIYYMCVCIGQNSVVSMSLNAVVSASFRLDKVTRDNQNPSRRPTRYEPGEAS